MPTRTLRREQAETDAFIMQSTIGRNTALPIYLMRSEQTRSQPSPCLASALALTSDPLTWAHPSAIAACYPHTSSVDCPGTIGTTMGYSNAHGPSSSDTPFRRQLLSGRTTALAVIRGTEFLTAEPASYEDELALPVVRLLSSSVVPELSYDEPFIQEMLLNGNSQRNSLSRLRGRREGTGENQVSRVDYSANALAVLK
ncbi:hypothetical protein NMY22_g12603 [Coprinellus aureogranulatus]|nr:hypothetical protein NMY22_g12603 [Coprinellus aureogranulatus]